MAVSRCQYVESEYSPHDYQGVRLPLLSPDPALDEIVRDGLRKTLPCYADRIGEEYEPATSKREWARTMSKYLDSVYADAWNAAAKDASLSISQLDEIADAAMERERERIAREQEEEEWAEAQRDYDYRHEEDY